MATTEWGSLQPGQGTQVEKYLRVWDPAGAEGLRPRLTQRGAWPVAQVEATRRTGHLPSWGEQGAGGEGGGSTDPGGSGAAGGLGLGQRKGAFPGGPDAPPRGPVAPAPQRGPFLLPSTYPPRSRSRPGSPDRQEGPWVQTLSV